MRQSNFGVLCCALLLSIGLLGCSDSNNNNNSNNPEPALMAGAASRSILPTVSGGRDYLQDAPGWPAAADLDADDPGIFVVLWDQGEVDVGNGEDDASWVHDDVRATALALEKDGQRVVLVSSDTYMHFKADTDEIARQARAGLTQEWADVEILITATHNHHGPQTAFGVNNDWYALAVEQIAGAVVDAVAALQPATASVVAGEHDYGSTDQRDPHIMDNRLNVLAIDAAESGDAIAAVVQWNAHPETTLGWSPPAESAGLDEACPLKGWEGNNCSAKGRYFSGDYPGVLQARLKASRGGEVLYFNGALGVQVGPGEAPNWVIDEDHPIGNGKTAPDGAIPLTTCDDEDSQYKCKSFAKTESTGTELANAVSALLENAEFLDIEEISVRQESFFSRLTNIGFRVLIGQGELGWQAPTAYKCGEEENSEKPFTEETCVDTDSATETDPVLTPVVDAEIASGDVMQTRIVHLDLGDVGFLFMPGELSPELVIGLPEDFNTAPPEKYYDEPELHAVGADYVIPGYLLSLVDESITFTIGLGTDQLGYFVPVSEYRLRCHGLSLSALPGTSCQDLADRGVIESPDWVSGLTCQSITDDPDALEALGADGPAVTAVCRYGQMVGRELGEPDGHYEETNAAGWDLVEDLWSAAERLFGES